MRALGLSVLLLFATSRISDAIALDWPRLIGDSGAAACRPALQIGKAVFQSDADVLYATTDIPPLAGSKLVLGPKEIDISGGDDLRADADVFARLPISGGGAPRHVYWQKSATGGVHWAVAERAMGWHGDMYSLFAAPERADPHALFAKYWETEKAGGLTPLVDSNWRPPLMIQDSRGALWAIDVGEPFVPLGNWTVYVAEHGAAHRACTLAFRPGVHDITKLLPGPVRQLARLLDSTLGSGMNEGTLQPTAQIRVGVSHMWANVAWRPWALPRQPYNTRAEVDRALTSWSRRAPAFRALYRSIIAQYPRAQRTLAAYYATHFHKRQNAADRSAAYALDIAFRSYFVFHREDSSTAPGSAANPWRESRF